MLENGRQNQRALQLCFKIDTNLFKPVSRCFRHFTKNATSPKTLKIGSRIWSFSPAFQSLSFLAKWRLFVRLDALRKWLFREVTRIFSKLQNCRKNRRVNFFLIFEKKFEPIEIKITSSRNSFWDRFLRQIDFDTIFLILYRYSGFKHMGAICWAIQY